MCERPKEVLLKCNRCGAIGTVLARPYRCPTAGWVIRTCLNCKSDDVNEIDSEHDAGPLDDEIEIDF